MKTDEGWMHKQMKRTTKSIHIRPDFIPSFKVNETKINIKSYFKELKFIIQLL